MGTPLVTHERLSQMKTKHLERYVFLSGNQFPN